MTFRCWLLGHRPDRYGIGWRCGRRKCWSACDQRGFALEPSKRGF